MRSRIPGSPEERLRLFARAGNFGNDVDVDAVVGIVRLAVSELPDDDRSLLRLAVSAIAFSREVDAVVAGEFELQTVENAILDAVLAHVRGKRGDA